MHLLADGAGYRMAYAARVAAGDFPHWVNTRSLVIICDNSVSIDDRSVEFVIDQAIKADPLCDIPAITKLVLAGARAQRDIWLWYLGNWYSAHLIGRPQAAHNPAQGGPSKNGDETQGDLGG